MINFIFYYYYSQGMIVISVTLEAFHLGIAITLASSSSPWGSKSSFIWKVGSDPKIAFVSDRIRFLMDFEPCLAVDRNFHWDVLSVLLAADVENVLAWPVWRRVQKTALKNSNYQMVFRSGVADWLQPKVWITWRSIYRYFLSILLGAKYFRIPTPA